MSANLYEMDRAAWLTRQVELIKSGRFALVDQEHLLEELEAEVGNYRREIKRRLRVLIAHLLKWKYQPDRRSSGWRGAIRVQRIDIADLLKDNPSLRQNVRQAIEDAYSDAVKLAADETGMLEDAYPASCEWEESELLNPDFWPE